MILRCSLMILIVICDEFAVRYADPGAFEESSHVTDISPRNEELTTYSAGSVTTLSKNRKDDDQTSDLDATRTIRTNNNNPEEYSTVFSSNLGKTTINENIFLNYSISSLEEITSSKYIDLELPTIKDENITQIQKEIIDLPRSKLLTTLINVEKEYNMSFDKLTNIFMEESKESNQNKNRRRKGREPAIDIVAELEDGLGEIEFIKQEVKHKSLGIKPLGLIVLPDRYTKSSLKGTETTSSWNSQYQKTSFLLTSDFEMDRAPFIVKSKSSKQLELQGENLGKVTHEATSLKKSPESAVYLLPPLTVELQEDSVLLMNANERQEIAFEVTNNLNNAARVGFTVRDELGILLEIDRYVALLGAYASATVRVAVLPRSGQRSDRIKFIATGSEQIRKEAVVDIESDYRSDTDIPTVDYNYLSDCTDIVLSKCKEGTWTIKISAKDTESGLKLLTTVPKGLYFPDGYTAGTKEEVSGIFSESCCNADLQIIAIDRMNNRYIRQINAYRAPLSFWAIIAISLVSLIFLTIIVVSSFICWKKCKKNEADSFDLPTYRGGRSRY